MSMTYASLVTDITNYLNRSDATTTAQIPSFISQAEQKLSKECENIGTEAYVVGTFIAGTSTYAKPGRWRRNLAINFGSGTGNNTRNTLYMRDYDTLRAYWPDDTVQGTPLFYADYGYSNFIVAPTPDDAYPFEFAYLELPEQLSIANQTNWFTNYAPNALLYGALLQSAPFLKNDDRIAMWEKQYSDARDSLKRQNNSRLVDRTSNIEADKGA